MAEYDFSKCMYDISVVGSGGLLKTFPELNAYSEFLAAESDNEIKIAICLSDDDSPFLKVKDFKQKVISIFEYLNVNMKSVAGGQLFDEVLEYNNERIFAMCGIYLQMQNNHNFTYWWNMNQLYYSLMNEMGKPRAKLANGEQENITHYVDRKLKIQKQADPIKKDLLNIESELFADSKMKMAIAKSKLRLTRTYAEMHSDENSVI